MTSLQQQNREFKAKLQEANAELAQREQLVKRLTQQLEEAGREADGLRSQVEHYSRRCTDLERVGGGGTGVTAGQARGDRNVVSENHRSGAAALDRGGMVGGGVGGGSFTGGAVRRPMRTSDSAGGILYGGGSAEADDRFARPSKISSAPAPAMPAAARAAGSPSNRQRLPSPPPPLPTRRIDFSDGPHHARSDPSPPPPAVDSPAMPVGRTPAEIREESELQRRRAMMRKIEAAKAQQQAAQREAFQDFQQQHGGSQKASTGAEYDSRLDTPGMAGHASTDMTSGRPDSEMDMVSMMRKQQAAARERESVRQQQVRISHFPCLAVSCRALPRLPV